MNRQAQIEAFTLAAHRLAVSRLREKPSRIEGAVAVLRRWREQAGPTRSDPYWDEWEKLLQAGVDAVELAVCRDDDHGATLRSMSPLGSLISQEERMQMLRQSRIAA